MNIKPNKVDLFDGSNRATQEFDINHAERILRMPNNGGWELPENSPYQFDNQNGLTIKPSARATKIAKEESDNTESN